MRSVLRVVYYSISSQPCTRSLRQYNKTTRKTEIVIRKEIKSSVFDDNTFTNKILKHLQRPIINEGVAIAIQVWTNQLLYFYIHDKSKTKNMIKT